MYSLVRLLFRWLLIANLQFHNIILKYAPEQKEHGQIHQNAFAAGRDNDASQTPCGTGEG